jgi:hypothetical protein
VNDTNKPTIIIPSYDPRDPPKISIYKRQIIILSETDNKYLNLWREKARRKYKRYFNYTYLQEEDETLLLDPDPFAKWYIFYINNK